MSLLVILISLIFILGILENISHQKRVLEIPIRIHVNGTRGKSTTTRLIASVLQEAGYSVLAKTTGTMPKIILENGEEEDIIRKAPANIIEQKRFIQKAVQRKCQAIVLECMAVHPETQWVSEHRLIHSTIGIITNIREDHQDVYGPYLKDAADALKMTIPKNSLFVTAEKKFFPILQNQAKKMNTQCILVEPDQTDLGNIPESENFYFKDNVTITLKVGELLGIDRNICLKGIAKANPDPGALAIYRLKRQQKLIWFVNAFAANDRESILLIWEKITQMVTKEMVSPVQIVLINHRDDRITRTIQFDKILSQDIKADFILMSGPTSQLSKNYLTKLGYPSQNIYFIRDDQNEAQVIDHLFSYVKDFGIVYGLGNTKGFGNQIIEFIKEIGEKI